jgi:hypothetical protein
MKRFLVECCSSLTTADAQLLFRAISYTYSQWDMDFLKRSLLPLSPLNSDCGCGSEAARISARILDVPLRITRRRGFLRFFLKILVFEEENYIHIFIFLLQMHICFQFYD